MKRFLLGLIFFAVAVCGCGKKRASWKRSGEMGVGAFWVWHRKSDLTEGERGRLEKAGVERLCWQVAEGGWRDGAWRMVEIAPWRGGGVVPVFRLKPEPGFLGVEGSAEALAARILEWKGRFKGEGGKLAEVQLDFDCPERLLGEYARWVRRLGEGLGGTRVSVTALAGWVRAAEFDELCAVVCEMAPMFYDLTADAPEEAVAGRFVPMAGGEAEGWVREWGRCGVKWRAGLPNFERVTVFAADGRLRGHVRGWTRDEVFFHDGLEAVRSRDGVTVYRVRRAGVLCGTRLEEGGWVVHRMPERGALRRLVKAADEAGAESVIWFALDGPGLVAAYDAVALERGEVEPELVVARRGDGSVVVRNVGEVDLPSRAVDGADVGNLEKRGWVIELRADGAGVFRSGSAGGFAWVGTGGGVPGEFAETMRLHVSSLRAGEEVRSGPILSSSGDVNFRVEGLGLKGVVISE